MPICNERCPGNGTLHRTSFLRGIQSLMREAGIEIDDEINVTYKRSIVQTDGK